MISTKFTFPFLWVMLVCFALCLGSTPTTSGQSNSVRQEPLNLEQVPLAFRRAVELAQAGGGQPLALDALMSMIRQGASEEEILQKLRQSSTRLRLTEEQLRELRLAGATAAVLKYLEKPPAVFRLTEVAVSRGYGFNFPQPEDKLLVDEKNSVYKSIPETIEVAARRSWYEERLILRVDAPEVVEDGQQVRLRSMLRAEWDFNLKEPNPSLPYYVATVFKYQKQEGEGKSGTPEAPVRSGNYHLETESDITVPVVAGDATFGGSDAHREFYLRAESGVGGSQAMMDIYFKYHRVPDEELFAAAPTAAMTDAANHSGSIPTNPNTAKAAEPTGMILRAPHVKVPRGSSVLIPVELINAKDVLNLDFVLGYKPDIATAHSKAEKGSLVTEIFQFNQIRAGEFKFNFAQLTPITGSGKVAGFRFDATGPAASKTPLRLSVHTVNDSNGRAIPITTVDGSISIYDPNNLQDPNHPNYQNLAAANEPIQPTCSGSTRQTVNDAQCCLKMWVGLTTRSLHMDMDQSGDVDSRDAVIVLRNVQESLLRTR